MISESTKQTTAGITKNKRAIASTSINVSIVPALAEIVEMTPTNPEVPMPEPAASHVILKRQVAIGPVIAEAIIGGSIIIGFLNTFGICNMEVPIPCAIKPAKRFSLKDCTAKPII